MDEGGVRADLVNVERSIEDGDADDLALGASRLQELVRKAGLPAALRAELLESYHRFGSKLSCRRALLGHQRGYGRHLVRRA